MKPGLIILSVQSMTLAWSAEMLVPILEILLPSMSMSVFTALAFSLESWIIATPFFRSSGAIVNFVAERQVDIPDCTELESHFSRALQLISRI